jgi:DNA-binding GntR family transcriptional regulator
VRLQRIIRDEEGVLLERVEALWRADRYEYRMELTRGQRGGVPGWIPD